MGGWLSALSPNHAEGDCNYAHDSEKFISNLKSISSLVEWRNYLEDKMRKYMGKDIARNSQNMHDVC